MSIIKPGEPGWDTAPVTVLRMDRTLEAGLYVILDLDLYRVQVSRVAARRFGLQSEGGIRIREYRALTREDARKWVDLMEKVFPGSSHLVNPRPDAWFKVTGRFERVRQPYMRPRSTKKARSGGPPSPYPPVA